MYTPNNPPVFIAAFAGALAGMGASDRVPTDTNFVDYEGLTSVAGAFAQSFDTALGSAPVPNSQYVTQSVEAVCEAVWEGRAPQPNPTNLNPTTYTNLCNALIAILKAGGAYLTGLGVSIQPLVSGEYGDGSDGQVNFDGVSAFPFAIGPIAGEYTLQRNVFSSGFNVSPGITVKGGGCQLFCNGKGKVQEGGFINNDGNPGAGIAPGGATFPFVVGQGFAGGLGGTNSPGNPGNNATHGAVGMAHAGDGGAGGANPGGSGGSALEDLVPSNPRTLYFVGQAANNVVNGGPGGGGGGSAGIDTKGGGGGGGAGNLAVVCFDLEEDGPSAGITCNGGNGGNASSAGASAGGGGGGGSGGILWLVYNQYSNPGAGPHQRRIGGGTGGNPVNGGVQGANGGLGLLIVLNA